MILVESFSLPNNLHSTYSKFKTTKKPPNLKNIMVNPNHVNKDEIKIKRRKSSLAVPVSEGDKSNQNE